MKGPQPLRCWSDKGEHDQTLYLGSEVRAELHSQIPIFVFARSKYAALVAAPPELTPSVPALYFPIN